MTNEQQYYIHAHQQSRIFMCEMFPTIYRLIRHEHNCLILDVGAATGAGTRMLSDLLAPNGFLHVKANVTALDLAPTFKDHAENVFQCIPYLVGDVSTVAEKTYDVVVSSHTIEHVDDPYVFLYHLKRIAAKHVVIACPYKEIDRIDGHVNTIDDTFINATKPKEVRIFYSAGWGLPCVEMVY